jgi:hypothetical protein
MCNEHEHYISYGTDDYSYLCFRHATIAAVAGERVDTEVTTYEQKSCEVCGNESLKRFLDGHVLTRKDHITEKVEPVEMNTIFKDFFDTGSKSTPEDIRKVLEKGNPVATDNYSYQYIKS